MRSTTTGKPKEKTLILFTSSILCILLIATNPTFADSSLSITTDDPIYKIGDTISIKITNNASEPAIFNYKIFNSDGNTLAQKCVTHNNTSGVILPNYTQLIQVYTSCAGMASIGDWVVSSKLTHDGKLADLFTLAKFSIVKKTPHHYNYSNDHFSSYIQNNTGWDKEIFSDYEKLKIIDKHGFFIMPIKFEGNVGKNDIQNDFILYRYIMFTLINSQHTTLDFLFPNSVYLQYYSKIGNFNINDNNVDLHADIVNKSNTHTHVQVDLDNGTHNIVIIPYGDPSKVSTFNQLQINKLYDYIFPPLKQTQNGIPQGHIICKENLELILHSNGSPACVKPESIPRLVELGWIKPNKID